MSADNIAKCPDCGAHRLREWADVGVKVRPSGNFFVVTYRAECYDCAWKWEPPARERQFIVKQCDDPLERNGLMWVRPESVT